MNSFANRTRVSFISLLLACRCPSAVGWLVISVVVNPVDAHSCGPLSHVRKEVYKVVPSLTNMDSPRTVLRKAAVVDVLASSNHRFPCVVNRPMAMPVLWLNAAATCGFSTGKVFSNDNLFVSALTPAEPLNPPARIVGLGNNCQSPKTLTSEREYSGSPRIFPKAPATCCHSTNKVLGADDAFGSALAATPPQSLLVSSFSERHNREPAKYFAGEVVNERALSGTISLSHDVALLNSVTMWIEPARVSALVPARFILAETGVRV